MNTSADVMNETYRPGSPSKLAESTGDAPVRVPNTSMLPGSERAPSALDAPIDTSRAEWVEGMRNAVRCRPLVAVATALTVGILMARIAR